MPPAQPPSPFRGVYTVIYRAADLEAARQWYASAFGVRPYFDEPFYVGFDINGYELGLQPAEQDQQPGPAGVVAYWGVDDIDDAVARLTRLGAHPREQIQDVGGGIRVATLTDPFGNLLGVIQNPNFRPQTS